MVLHNADVTGSLILNNVNISGITGSAATSASFASQINSLNAFSGSILAYTSSANASFLSIETATGSLNTYTGSNNANIASISANIASLSAGSASSAVLVNTLSGSVSSLNAYTASNNATVNTIAQATVTNAASIASLTSVTGSYATTGSNIFVAPQFINQASNAISFTSTASLYTNGGARVSKDLFVSGTTYLNNLTVYGTSSIQYITSSQVNIGTNIITVNTDTPSVRFGGLAVFDSGSTGLTGSILWDSEKNHWVYANPSGSSYSGGMMMSGPRSSALGSEQGTLNNYVMKGQGGDHITSSAIIEDGTLTSMYSTMYVSSSGNVGVGTPTPAYTLDVNGTGRFTLFSTTNPSLRLDYSSTSNYGRHLMNPNGEYVISSPSSNGVTSGNLVLQAGSEFRIYTNNTATSTTAQLSLNPSGNLGLGVSPSAWSAAYVALQVGGVGSISTTTGGATFTHLTNGAFFNGTNWIYSYTSVGVARYTLTDSGGGTHQWFTSPNSGTAGNAISFTQAMTLNASGNLSLGNTNDTYKLDVSGTGRFSSFVEASTNFISVALTNSISVGTSTAENAKYNYLGHSGYWGLKTTATGFNFALDTYNGGTPKNVLTITQAGAATFSSSVTIQGGNALYVNNAANTRVGSLATTGDGTELSSHNGSGEPLYLKAPHTTANIIFVTNGTNTTGERMRILANGNVGIGTNNPTFRLDVNADSIRFGDGGSATLHMNVPNSSGVSGNINVGGSPRITILGTGNVGIGTSNPSHPLTTSRPLATVWQPDMRVGGYLGNLNGFIGSCNGARVVISGGAEQTNNDNADSWATAYNSDASFLMVDAGVIKMFTNSSLTTNATYTPTERMRITSGGYLKASNNGSYGGATNPNHEIRNNNGGWGVLDVTHFATSNPYGLSINFSNASPNNTSNFFIYSADATEGKFVVWANGDVDSRTNSYGGWSDIKLKENISDATPKLNDLLKVKVKNYNFIGDDKKQLGVVAQELEEIFPALISETPDYEINKETGVKVNLGTTTKSVKYSVFVPMLIKAIQEQQAQIEELKLQLNK
jgi:hypothetical protein